MKWELPGEVGWVEILQVGIMGGGGVDTVIAIIKKNQTFVLICGNYVMKK